MSDGVKERDTLTASRMAALLSCPRKHYYRYELGLLRELSLLALRFGVAFHDGMEGRWLGLSFHECLEAVLAKAERFDPLGIAICSTRSAFCSRIWMRTSGPDGMSCRSVTMPTPRCRIRRGWTGSVLNLA
jgi:hypothetical protein